MMKKSYILSFILLIFSFVNTLNAQEINADRFENIVKSLKLNKSKIKTELCTEKKMPNENDSYIIVIPILLYEDEGSFSVQNYILITDETGKINVKFTDEVVDSDAITLTGISIDTGYYSFNENTRAFGIRHHFTGQSQPNPYSSEDISLFYISARTLKKILNRFELNSYSGEWDTRCAGEFDEKNSTIVLDKQKTNNFTNLTIKTKTAQRKNKEIKGDCKNFETSKTTYKTLKFSNGIYK